MVLRAFCTDADWQLMRLAEGRPGCELACRSETPADAVEDAMSTSWNYSTNIVWGESKPAKGLVDVLACMRLGLRVCWTARVGTRSGRIMC